MSRFEIIEPQQRAERFEVVQPPATTVQRMLASPVGAVLHGMQKPLDAWAEYAPWALGTAAGALGADRVSQWAMSEAERARVINQGHRQAYDDAR